MMMMMMMEDDLVNGVFVQGDRHRREVVKPQRL